MAAYCTCGRNWTGLNQAHCTVCHEHFSTVANFDRHRPGGHCVAPADLRDRNGKRVFKRNDGPLGLTWVHNSERPEQEDVTAA